MIGSSVSHYRILASIGAGGMGVVYLAEDERLHRKVALKFLPPAIAQDAHARARLLREAQAASALDHPNVATVYDIGEWNGQLFIAMPFYDGETLRQRIERGPLRVGDAARIAGHIAAGLAAAHAAGIVYRDLKPANVMLTHDDRVRIVDFGLAKVFSETQDTVARMTAAGTTVGTAAYMAPEPGDGPRRQRARRHLGVRGEAVRDADGPPALRRQDGARHPPRRHVAGAGANP
jgi:eukaryotic-like serine/threonine-protein kinase